MIEVSTFDGKIVTSEPQFDTENDGFYYSNSSVPELNFEPEDQCPVRFNFYNLYNP